MHEDICVIRLPLFKDIFTQLHKFTRSILNKNKNQWNDHVFIAVALVEMI